ncbi:cytochrome c oxidase subunit II transmembrane domain-containing protein [Propionivibrio sp.]|uniref:cytochrome c oxidase subunit II transmembrane domain-containing protein n=1 Tax=Propionivibrio sp. TaxID=2212460 RepID=UPI0025FA0751|nr:cytochrome c oxidase subunit II transmembrane domain-containing protein [Propionivibrio sp.]
MHNGYMIFVSTLFAVVFMIMILSLVKHRKTSGHLTAKFSGPTGTVQWLWALVPFVILAYIDVALINLPNDRNSSVQKKIELAVAQDLPSSLPEMANNTPATGSEINSDTSSSANRQQALR